MSIRTKIKGIIFDMDNTLLQSKIDFSAMKQDIFTLLVENKVLPSSFPVQDHTPSTMLEHAKQFGLTDALYLTSMDIAAKHEEVGMAGAGLEPGVKELLQSIKQEYTLVVLTNNSYPAALKALEYTDIVSYFDFIIAREQMTSLKPSPSGFHFVMNEFQEIKMGEWITIGDSWIDGKAANAAGIPFISYRTSLEEMENKGVKAVARVEHISGILSIIR